jgi:thiol-disulfide isomerase/thioredoxin
MPRNGRRTAGPVAALLAVAALAACTAAAPTGIDYTGADGTITVLDASRRGEPVALAGTTLEGDPLSIAADRGSVVVLNVWGSWCPPCHKEAPEVQRASVELADRGVRFVGIDTRDPDPAPALAFQRSYDIGYPSLADPDGQLLLALRGAVAPKAVPSTLVLDGEGRVAARITGAVTSPMLTAVVGSVLDDVPVVLDLDATPSSTPSTTPSSTPSGTP